MVTLGETLALKNRAIDGRRRPLWIMLFLLVAGEWTGLPGLKMAGGYGGPLSAAFAFYLSAANVISDAHQRTVLPIGVPGAAH